MTIAITKPYFVKKLFVICLLVLSLASCSTQKDFFKAELEPYKLHFGMQQDEFLGKFENSKMESDADSFRQIHSLGKISDRIDNAVVYFTKENGKTEFYEIILIINDNYQPETIAKEFFGAPNFKGKEWIFKANDKVKFDVCAWVYKNKLVIASALPGSEWEPGFEE